MTTPPGKPIPTTDHNSLQGPLTPSETPPHPPKASDKLPPTKRQWSLAFLKRFPRFLKPIKQIPLTWLGALGAITLFILTALYAMTATLGRGSSWSHGTQSHSILLLRVLSEATGLFLGATIASSLERLQWMLISRVRGLSLPTIFAFQPGTGVLGMLNLTFAKGFGWGTRLFSLAHLFLKLIIPVLAILIMSEVTTELTSIPQKPFPVAAGIGPFEPSYADDYSLIAGIYFATDLTSFLSNPQRVVAVDPIQQPIASCTLDESQKRSKACSASYFVPGGFELITPWPSKNEDDWSAEVYVVNNLQGYQLDFTQISTDTQFNGALDCVILGSSTSAIQICLTSSSPQTLNAKLVPCPLSISSDSACSTNTTWHASTGWSTSLTPYISSATTSFSRSNGSILTTSSPFPPPKPAQISPQDLLAVYTASFNNSETSSANQFIEYFATILTFAETSSLSYTAADSYLRNLLALPLYYFHANNLAPDIVPSPDAPLAGLPKELYTTASLATVSYHIIVGRATVLLYIAIAGLVLLLCLGVLVVGSVSATAGRCPETTYWPVVDFIANCREDEGEGMVGRLKECRGLGNGREVRRRIGLGVLLDEGKEGV